METIQYLTNKIIQLEIVIGKVDERIHELLQHYHSAVDELQETKRIFQSDFPDADIDTEITKQYNSMESFYQNHQPSILGG